MNVIAARKAFVKLCGYLDDSQEPTAVKEAIIIANFELFGLTDHALQILEDKGMRDKAVVTGLSRAYLNKAPLEQALQTDFGLKRKPENVLKYAAVIPLLHPAFENYQRRPTGNGANNVANPSVN